MNDKLREASSQSIDKLQAAAWRAVSKLGYNDVQERQWREMQRDPYLMQDHIIRAAQQRGYVNAADINAFAEKFIQDMERQFGG